MFVHLTRQTEINFHNSDKVYSTIMRYKIVYFTIILTNHKIYYVCIFIDYFLSLLILSYRVLFYTKY